ncbi:MAG TPA: cytochrome c [Usitatibacter sp.]|nr:cytochrome c [Usitatibacter sp.]
MKTRKLLLAAAAGMALAAAPLAFGIDADYGKLARGRYLVHAGDCAACHTDDGGQPFAGGRAIPTPFGTIYSTNITPDKETGIGGWTDEQFYAAMHEGVRPNGQHLYPAFPYPWFTKLTRDDVLAIKAYLDSMRPVKQEAKPPGMPWPLTVRESVAGWNMLFFKPGTFQPNAGKSPQWNRGAYLVEGLGHCGACHSPKNVLGGVKKKDRFEGGKGEGWFATSLVGNDRAGLGSWSKEEIVEYLKTGANDRARAMGPMAEVVHNSTMYLKHEDLEAIATYLKDLPAEAAIERNASLPSSDDDRMKRGRLVYVDQCAGCHMENGQGVAHVFPAIKGNTGVHAQDPTSLARLVLEGAPSAKTPAKPEGFAMPAFGWKLGNEDIADVLTYIRASWGNKAAPVEASKVADVRKQVAKMGSG